MKLLAQFYACLAVILFVAMIGSAVDAFSSGLRYGLLPAEHPPPQKSPPNAQLTDDANHERARRAAPRIIEKLVAHHGDHEAPTGPPRARRQVPDGIPNPQDMMNKMPMPQGRK